MKPHWKNPGDTLGPLNLNGWPEQGNQGDQGNQGEYCDKGDKGEKGD